MFGGIGKALGLSSGKSSSGGIGPSGGMMKKMFNPENMKKKKLPRDSQAGNGAVKEGMKLLATNRPNIRTSGNRGY